MSIKVKGEAIKEGSIPLSALTTEVKDKIENVGADWNAQEGEAGYIKNRTHYRDYNLDAIPSIVNVPLLDEVGDYYTFKFNYIKLPEDWFNIENDTIKLLKPLIFKVNTPSYSDEWNYDDYNDHDIPYKTSFGDTYESNCDIGGDNACIIYIHDNNIYKDGLYFAIDLISTPEVIKVKHLGVKTLDEEYLPNTVVKTTPQTLTDTDKNQALANLGIDPVYFKYLCNPCQIYISDTYDDNINNVPEDIIPIIFNEDGTPNKNLLNLCVFKIPSGSTEYLAKPTYIEDNQSIYVDVPGISLSYEQSDNAIYNPDHPQ